MGYLYSGEFSFREGDEDNIETIIDILRVADEEFLDDVSQSVSQLVFLHHRIQSPKFIPRLSLNLFCFVLPTRV